MKLVSHHQGCCDAVATRPDGTEWPHVLTLETGTVVCADSARECLEELVPGYERCTDDDARLAARIRHAHHGALSAQRGRIETARAHGLLARDARDDDEDDLALVDVLLAPRSAPLLLALPGAPGVQAPWEGPVPLVAVTTTYAPYTDTPPLQGDVLWLDPTTEQAYLRSLARAGLHDYWSVDAC